MSEIIYPQESYQIVGACFNVYNSVGCGFLEAVYQECLGIELDYQNIPAVPWKEIEFSYRNRKLEQTFKPDFVCYDKIIVELKAVSKLRDEHRAQVLNYLNASNFKLGLLINFGSHPKLEYERLVLTEQNMKYHKIYKDNLNLK